MRHQGHDHNEDGNCMVNAFSLTREQEKILEGQGYVTKDSGQRQEFDSGMQRDVQEGKPRFDLIMPKGIPFLKQLLTRWAMLMERGRAKYGERNWEKAEGLEEMDRAKASALRHFMQWYHGEKDEDHAVAVFFNITEAEYVGARLENSPKISEPYSCSVTLAHVCRVHPNGPGAENYDC